MRRYNQRVYRIARSIVTDDAAAMDIVQEAHIKAYTKLNDFQDQKGRNEEVERVFCLPETFVFPE